MKENIPGVKAKITWKNSDAKATIKAKASIMIADSFQVNGISVISGQNGLFVSMPQRQFEGKNGEKKYFNIAHPITPDMKKAINEAVMDAYNQTPAVTEKAEQTTEESSTPEETATEDEEPVPVMNLG